VIGGQIFSAGLILPVGMDTCGARIPQRCRCHHEMRTRAANDPGKLAGIAFVADDAVTCCECFGEVTDELSVRVHETRLRVWLGHGTAHRSVRDMSSVSRENALTQILGAHAPCEIK
jgi:hypothetical protein